jgi:hypothetical protein
MSDSTLNQDNPIDYVRAAVDDQLAIGFTATCEARDGKIIVTLCYGKNSDSFAIPEDLQDVDSDGVTDALRMPMERARRALLALDARSKPKRRGGRAPKKFKRKARPAKRKKAKRSKKPSTSSAAGVNPTEDSGPVSSEPSVPATAAPTSIEGDGDSMPADTVVGVE